MKEKPVILITEPEQQVITKDMVKVNINNYDNSHLFYKGIDLGTFKEIYSLKQENQTLKIQISAREEEYLKLQRKINKIIDKVKDILILKKARCLNEDDYILSVTDLDDIRAILEDKGE